MHFISLDRRVVFAQCDYGDESVLLGLLLLEVRKDLLSPAPGLDLDGVDELWS